MSLTFREQEAIRRAGVVEIVCAEVPDRTFRLTAARLRARNDDRDLVALVRDLLNAGAIMPGFVMPDGKFLKSIVFSASPRIREMLARAAVEDENHE